MNPDNPSFRTPEEERRAAELVAALEAIAKLTDDRDKAYAGLALQSRRIAELEAALEHVAEYHLIPTEGYRIESLEDMVMTARQALAGTNAEIARALDAKEG